MSGNVDCELMEGHASVVQKPATRPSQCYRQGKTNLLASIFILFLKQESCLWRWKTQKQELCHCLALDYSGIPHLTKWILRKWDTAFLKKVSSYKKVFSLKKMSLSYNFLVYGSLHYNEPSQGIVHVLLLYEYQVMDIRAVLKICTTKW